MSTLGLKLRFILEYNEMILMQINVLSLSKMRQNQALHICKRSEQNDATINYVVQSFMMSSTCFQVGGGARRPSSQLQEWRCSHCRHGGGGHHLPLLQQPGPHCVCGGRRRWFRLAVFHFTTGKTYRWKIRLSDIIYIKKQCTTK